MPFTRTWSEELIAEWLQLKGYFVEVNVPIRSGKSGGRNEADIIGVREKNQNLEIKHIEVGSLPGNPESNAQMISNKFSTQRKNDIINYCRAKIGASYQKTVYTPLYVAVWWSDKTMNYLKQQNLPVQSLMNFIDTEIRPTIRNWKNNPSHVTKTKGKSITLPEGMWLLYLVDYISNG